MKNRTIVHVLRGQPDPDTLNGVNKVVHNLASQQNIQGMNVQVWAIVGKEPQVEYDHQYPLRIFEVQKFRFFLDESMNDSVSMMPRDTIFHLHSVFVPELYALSRRLKKQKLKWVIAPHGGYAPGSLRKNSIAKLAYMAFFEKRLIHQASAMHAIGLYGEADQFNNQAYKSKIGLVPNGQNLPKDGLK